MDMKTIFRAFGPDFKKNHLAEPFDSIHIYPLMCKLLGVTPEPHNGSLAVTQEMLVQHEHNEQQQPGEIQEQPPGNWQSDLFCPEIQKNEKEVGRGSEGATGRIEQNNPVCPTASASAGQDSSSS